LPLRHEHSGIAIRRSCGSAPAAASLGSAPGRDGAAKAGNLKSALAFLREQHPEVAYIETRDADDELGSTSFLRSSLGPLVVSLGS
jgi:hypothetical protein